MAKQLGKKPEWILLIHQLPPKPTNLRVRIWRKLQSWARGDQDSVYVSSGHEKTHEDFSGLGKRSNLRAASNCPFSGSVEGATDEEIIAAFRKARDEEFAAITSRADV